MKKNKDGFGNRMKSYEYQSTSRKLMNGLPIVIRLDGKNFSKFTSGLERPFDERLSGLMMDTMHYLVKQVNANCGYTQSDEISLLIYEPDTSKETIFGGRVQKIESLLAGMATAFFVKNVSDRIPEKAHLYPIFDCRAFNVPNPTEAVNEILWREQDATKNSITMAARTVYSDNEVKFKNGNEKQEMLFQKGINWNDYPAFFKRGTYTRRVRVTRPYTKDELEVLPPKHNAHTDPDLVVERWERTIENLPPLSRIKNRVDVLLFGAEPETDK